MSKSLLCSLFPSGTQLRLMDGDTAHSGRVEVNINGKWSTICDSSFDDADARVVCDMLGYHDTGIAKSFKGSHFGQGQGDVVLTSLACRGTEMDILNCSPGWGSSCNHRNDAGVNCDSTGIRLVDGPSNTSGRVEVFHGGQWGTICASSYFDQRDVHVICRMLGVNNPNVFGYPYAFYGEGNGVVMLSQLRCDGSESDIAQCPSSEWTVTGHAQTSSCLNHAYDAGVNCDGETQVRLTDGVSEASGRLEILHNGHWGSVSSSGFDNHDLEVVCRMLGFEHTGLQCNGGEADIGLCAATWWPKTKPGDHKQDVGINCDGVVPIRLANIGSSSTNGSGRVEVLHNGLYGTVCNNNFDRLDLIVVCRMLGFDNIPRSAYWHPAGTDPVAQGLGEIVVSDLTCNGIEYSIGQCGGRWPAYSSCDHSKDVFVNCNGASEALRLVGGTNKYNGRVEIQHAGNWGTICDSSFDRADAVQAVAYHSAHFGAANDTVPLTLTDLHCNGLETNLGQCNPTWAPQYCYHRNDVGVDCCPHCQDGSQIVG
ncbi:DMBT1-like protein [Mya arenaria]|uniref:DMBT1-like protein n=1 Tax=Mya arenaria TaxID=6604 RepID=A0ABY7DI10_MYAAR|nr:DMBT1-like protein [Mya arenaria]